MDKKDIPCFPSPLVFRLNDHGQGPELVRQVFSERGWVEFQEGEQDEEEWNLWWRTSRFRASDYEQLQPWQVLNHYPKSTAVTKKDSLARNLKRMRAVYGASAYNFSPIAFNLPNDYTKFVAEYTKIREKHPDKTVYWICKPADLSRGRGIFVFKDLSELQYDCNAVVQQYLSNPLLISGYKFDLRIYVLVPSFHPLVIYVYKEGLVRFSTEKYDLNSLGNTYSHLTNTSINKFSPTYTTEKERVGSGCKWTLTQLRHYFHQINIDDDLLWSKIVNIVTLTIIIQAHQVPKAKNCFELYGFDIMIDENLKPWLLEVNFSPALGSDCQIDEMVKKPMLHDLIGILNFPPSDKQCGKKTVLKQVDYGQLPRISKPESCPFSLVSPSSSLTFSEEEETDVPPIVPGCGLPSVQQQARSKLITNFTKNKANHSPLTYVIKHQHGNFDKSGNKRMPDADKTKKESLSKHRDILQACGESSESVFHKKEKKHSPVHQNGDTSIESLLEVDLNVTSCSMNKTCSISLDQKCKLTPSYSANSIAKKSALIHRQINFDSCTKSNQNGLLHHRLTYSRPRQISKSSQKLRLSTTQPLISNENKNFSIETGEFVQVFPFNEITRRCAQSTLETRVIVRECLNLIKQYHSDHIETHLNTKKNYLHA